MAEPSVHLFNDKYHFIEYLNSGIFTEQEKKYNNMVLINIVALINAGIYILSIVYFELLNIFVIKENIFNYMCLGIFGIFIYIYQLNLDYYKWIEVNIKKTKFKYSNIWVWISLVVLIFAKNTSLYIPHFNIGSFIGILDFIIYCNLWKWLLTISLLYLILNKAFYKKIELTINAQHKYLFNDIAKEFYYRDVRHVICTYHWLIFIALIFNRHCIAFNLLITVITCFLFTPYNNRFFLNEKFLSYYSMIRSKNLFIKTCKSTYYFAAYFILLSTIIINQIDTKLIFYLLANYLLFTFNILMNTLIYTFGYSKIEEDKTKLTNVEIASGMLYLIQLGVFISIITI
jgi:hypothetical protein